jgi:hypothetical protein
MCRRGGLIRSKFRITGSERIEFHQFYLNCLAHASYLIGSDGIAAVVDPQRDIDIYLQEASKRGPAPRLSSRPERAVFFFRSRTRASAA